ncbi:DFP-domain-containing protein [Auriscalpium vulgare]|uniref:DFP-domain-containing protein n=1 Tax=Auriscalpium vulgare TaxID=40419 RepID=A0ACB8RCM8_9AGAM|nr:DFP-domain-containing protein [Auriscalpium vulgare]
MASTSSSSTTHFSAESYFATQLPPPTLAHDIDGVRAFVARQRAAGKKVVLVTSGGTTVPLELNVVRFLDNFSAGTRGATSAEYFLKAGYAVVFMHRQFSLQPFSRHYSHSTNPFLDLLEIETPAPSSSVASTSPTPDITVTSTQRADLLEILTSYKHAHTSGLLHTLTFVTVNDYLWLLRAVAQELAVLKHSVLYYLAAAVSDFFLPRQKMSEHKIQSGKGSLLIEMDQVPKILKPMVDEWSPDGFVVSFKLETDPTLLIPKARAALARYGHQIVIGNDLNRRKHEVVFVARAAQPPTVAPALPSSDLPSSEENGDVGLNTVSWLRIAPDAQDVRGRPREIEEDIVRELVGRHQAWIDRWGGDA